jgi:hypothetical protein
VIARDDKLQCLRCTVCGEVQELLRKEMREPYRLIEMQEEMQLDHALGEKAIPAECKYRKGMREAMRPAPKKKMPRARRAA